MTAFDFVNRIKFYPIHLGQITAREVWIVVEGSTAHVDEIERLARAEGLTIERLALSGHGAVEARLLVSGFASEKS